MPTIFNKKKNRFELNGKEISLSKIRREIQKLMNLSRREMEAIGKRLRDGKSSTADWFLEMKQVIKSAHIVSSSIGYGGRKMMDAQKFGRVGAAIKKQNKYLEKLQRNLESGKVTIEQIMRRSTFYANSIHEAYYKAEMIRLKESFSECRRVQNSREGCKGCNESADKGFIPIDEQPPIGDLECQSFCLCVLEYR